LRRAHQLRTHVPPACLPACLPAVLKRLTDKRVVQPIKAACITFDPTPKTAKGSSSSNGGAKDCSLTTDLLMLVAANSRQMGRTVAVAPGQWSCGVHPHDVVT
jgi:hypothetical protein